MNKNQYEKFAEKLEKAIDWRVEYETTHEDAGSNYSHLPREGGWDYSNGPDRLLAWCEEAGIDTDRAELVEIEDEILDWCEIEPGHIFSATTPQKFIVDSYPVGEVEDQYCLPDLARLLDTDEETAREFAQLAMDDNRFCLRPNGDGGVLSYTSTDAVWVFYVNKEWIKDRLESIRED